MLGEKRRKNKEEKKFKERKREKRRDGRKRQRRVAVSDKFMVMWHLWQFGNLALLRLTVP